jgi:AAA family ATP:ADP antiporter
MKFFIILALTLTRDTKDTLIVTQCGAESIAFLKIYGVLPIATLYIAYYSKLSNIVSSKKILFYITCIPFFVFFLMYDLLIHPNTHLLHPSIDTVRHAFQTFGLVRATVVGGSTSTGGISILMNMIAHWTSAIFYIMAELYSSVSVGLLFWSFANDVVSIEQAKRFYPLFAQMSGLAPVLAGQYMVHYASRAPNFAQSLHRLTIAITLAGIMICASYYQSCNYVERTEGIKIDDDSSSSSNQSTGSTNTTQAAMKETTDNNNNTTTATTETTTTVTTKKKKKKPKLSMTESAKFLAGSQYLRLIAMLVLGYGLSINFTEIIWKSLVKKLYPNPLDYQRFMGNFSSVVGICTCIVIFFGVHVIRLLGWRVGAMATPSIMAVISVPFFVCIFLGIDHHPLRLQTAVLCGTILSLVSKTSKYALFDPTTQMAYIPLDEESKIKGKAAIDVLGSRIGKSGGSFIQQGLVFGFGNILNAAPVVATIYYSVLMAWISAANRLSTLFHNTQQQNEQQQQQTNTTDEATTEPASNESLESKKDK